MGWSGTITFTLAGIATLLSAASAPVAQAQGRPNVVILMTDDTGWNDFGAYGGGANLGHPTPNIDKVARKAPSSPVGMARRVAPRAAPRS